MQVADHDQENNQHTEEPVSSFPLPDGEEKEQPAQTIYHIYVVKEAVSEETPPIVEQDTNPLQKHNRLLSVIVLVGFMLAGLGMGMLSPFLLAPSVTVAITPVQKTLTTTQTISLRSPTLHTRPLPTLTLSQELTVQTTGRKRQNAQPATGQITFYNAAPYEQTIAHDTLFLTASGIQVITDETAVIPGATFPIMGHITVPAHTLQTGEDTNLPALAINTACCVVNVFAQNSTSFTGGQGARTYPVVTKQDIDTASASVQASLQRSISAALHTQVHEHESFVTLHPCATTHRSTHAVGSEAKEITVTVTMTCQGYAYNTQALLHLLVQQQTHESIRQFGSGFHLVGKLHIETLQLTTNQQKQFLTVQSQGFWRYQFTTHQLDALAQQIAGKNTEQATSLLLRERGVNTVSYGEPIETLPIDASRIQLIVLS